MTRRMLVLIAVLATSVAAEGSPEEDLARNSVASPDPLQASMVRGIGLGLAMVGEHARSAEVHRQISPEVVQYSVKTEHRTAPRAPKRKFSTEFNKADLIVHQLVGGMHAEVDLIKRNAGTKSRLSQTIKKLERNR